MTSITAYLDRQHELFGRIARTVENLKRSGKENISRHAIDTRLHLLEGHWEKFVSAHDTILAAVTSEQKKQSYFTEDLYSQCEEQFCLARTELLQMKDEFPAASTALSVAATTPTPRSTRTLPKFSGDYHEWRTFHDLFSSMVIDNSDISAVERLHYLKSHVTGEASRLLANIAVTAENFTTDWDALLARYDNKRMLLASCFDRLTELKKMSTKSAEGLKSLLATTCEVIGNLDALSISQEDAWNMFLAYFVARRLDHDTLEAWELQLGNATEPALFPELQTFLDGCIRALELVGAPSSSNSKPEAAKSPASKGKTSVRANAATTKANRCSLCSASHYIGSCPDFAKKSLEDRREFVKTKRLCFNCLGEHLIADCRTVKCCRTCGERHHTLIHSATSSPAVATQPPSHVGQLRPTNASQSSVPQPAAPAAGSALSHSATLAPEVHRPTTLLATARVRVAADW
ncbi:PREDICTED: uncharacterized protein LOC105557213 [Vollenhovia emeryi]|uniref:uncharacterized protein LOC105557213 n=1 Tax=Vollenhovia emeryi TaxID=411798 RepID=UPI0005F52E35|nr:PREDICTED: uncharacterized protein LOC105557213 [Vollenhovia emeryi]